MEKIKNYTTHRNIVPAGGFVKNIGRRGILIAAGAILLAAGLIVCLSLKKESNLVPPEPPAVPASEHLRRRPKHPHLFPCRASFRPFRAVQSRQETVFRSGCPPSGSCHISVTITDRLIAMIGAMSRQLPPRLPLPSD